MTLLRWSSAEKCKWAGVKRNVQFLRSVCAWAESVVGVREGERGRFGHPDCLMGKKRCFWACSLRDSAVSSPMAASWRDCEILWVRRVLYMSSGEGRKTPMTSSENGAVSVPHDSAGQDAHQSIIDQLWLCRRSTKQESGLVLFSVSTESTVARELY